MKVFLSKFHHNFFYFQLISYRFSSIISLLPTVSHPISEQEFNEFSAPTLTQYTRSKSPTSEQLRPRSRSKFYTNQLFEEYENNEELMTSSSTNQRPRSNTDTVMMEQSKKVISKFSFLSCITRKGKPFINCLDLCKTIYLFLFVFYSINTR